MTNAELNDLPAAPLSMIVLLFGAVIVGEFAALVALPHWLPGLSNSLLGPERKAYWYLARTSGFVAYGLLWLSVGFGLLITNKIARVWNGGPLAFDLHQFTSLLALVFAFFHAVILLGDRHIGYSFVQLLLPFASGDYRPFWVGLGQFGLDLMAIVGLSFYVRRQLGARAWRALHYASFLVYVFATLHGLWAGTDTATPGALFLYTLSGASVYFLTLYRILISVRQSSAARKVV